MNRLFEYNGNDIISLGDYNIKGICHRGFNYSTSSGSTIVVNNADGAPENTLPAYRLAKQKGFKYVETDVSFTSDNVAVCLHDATIDRTSNGSGDIGSLTLAQVRQYSFNYVGSTKINGYDGVTIPTFEEFIQLCRDLALHPYIELKSSATYSEAQIQSIVDLVVANGMKGKVTYISFNSTYLTYVKNYDNTARLGYLVFDMSGATPVLNQAAINIANGLKTGYNEVFISSRIYTDAACQLCISGGVTMETWGICNNDTKSEILGLNHYISGVTSNKFDAGLVFFQNAIEG